MKKSNAFFHLFEEEIIRKSNFPDLSTEKSIPELFYSNFSLFLISSSINF
jgi:hypothetical protein